MKKMHIASFILTLVLVLSLSKLSYAYCCNGCRDCSPPDPAVESRHQSEVNNFKNFSTNQFENYRDWFANDFLTQNVVPELQRTAQRLTVSGMQVIFNVGRFMDSKHQLETQRLLQELHFEAQKKYQPDEDVCTFGTAVRSMAHTESAAKTAALGLNTRQVARHLGHKNTGGSNEVVEDKLNRWRLFTQRYCDPEDNDWIDGTVSSGLTTVCGDADGNNDENFEDPTNLDIDYTRLVENKRILAVEGANWIAAGDELDVLSLGNNLYGHNVLSRNFGQANVKNTDLAQTYMQLRSLAAQRNVAEATYNNLIGMRSVGTGLVGAFSVGAEGNGYFIGRILMDLGIPENEVMNYLGIEVVGGYQQTSYLATLEILTKKLFQNPHFYANLYDSPANVKRKSAALKAFELMLDRAINESQLRQEMAMSVLLSSRLRAHVDEANRDLGGN